MVYLRKRISLSISAKAGNINSAIIDRFRILTNTALRFVDTSRDKPATTKSRLRWKVYARKRISLSIIVKASDIIFIQWIELEFSLIPLCALWMPPVISRKEDRFQSYHSGYHEVAPALDCLCRKHIALAGIRSAAHSMYFFNEI